MTENNHERTAKQCTIFAEYNSTGDLSKTITILEDCRGDGCTYTTDPTVINQALADFSGNASVKMEVSRDPTCEGVTLTLTNNRVHTASMPRVHSNQIGHCERDEEGWVWYSRGEFIFNKNGGRGYCENHI